MATTLVAPPEQQPRRDIHTTPTTGDRVFRAIVVGAAWSVLLILFLITLFLALKAWPALHDSGWHFFTTFQWHPDDTKGDFGIAAVLYGTVMIALIALVVALPIALGTALFINEYVPPRVGRLLVPLVDLLAAVPSLIYGMWGLYWLQPHIKGETRWMSDHLGFIPIFKTSRPVFGSSMFIAGLVVALMVIPIIASVTREVLSQMPSGQREGALALGASRWSMIRRVMLPFGRSGIVGATMLGLGRALGETIAIALILSFNDKITTHILEPGGGSVAGRIANQVPEAGADGRSALIAAGLALFVLTLFVNMAARRIVNKSVREIS